MLRGKVSSTERDVKTLREVAVQTRAGLEELLGAATSSGDPGTAERIRRAPAHPEPLLMRPSRWTLVAGTVIVASGAAACGGTAARTETASGVRLDGSGRCGGFEARPLASGPVSLLADHLTMRPIEGLAPSVRSGLVMEAPEPDAGVSRLSVEESADHELLLLATELFRRPGEDSVASVSDWLAGEGEDAEVRPIEVGGGLRAVLAVPRRVEPEEDSGATAVARVVVAAPDDTAQHLGMFLTPEAAERGYEGCGALLARMARTLAPGSRHLATAGGRVELTRGVAIDVAPDWAVLAQPGPDFDVTWITRVVPLGGPHSGLGIYLGDHPSPHSNEAIDLHEEPGTLFGVATTWRVWTTRGRAGRDEHRETIVEVPGRGDLRAHVFMVTEDPAPVADMTAMASSLVVEDVAEDTGAEGAGP